MVGIKEDNTISNSVYYRKAFNELGDVIAHLNIPNQKTMLNRYSMTYSHWNGIKLLNVFAGYSKIKKVHLFFLFPNYPISEY